MTKPVEREEDVPAEEHGATGGAGPPISSPPPDLKKSTVLRKWRARLARVRISADDRPTMQSFSEVETSTRRVRAAILEIPDQTSRAILMMRILDGLNIEEVAGRLSIPVQQVGERYRSALRLLHKEMGDWLPRNRPAE